MRDFVRNYSTIVKPLHDLIANYDKHRKIVWTPETTSAYNAMKFQVGRYSTMHFLSDTASITLCTDASDYGVGGYFFQTVDGIDQPVAFLSKSLNKSQLRWSVIQKEANGIFNSCTYLQSLLRDRLFTIIERDKIDSLSKCYLTLSNFPHLNSEYFISTFDQYDDHGQTVACLISTLSIDVPQIERLLSSISIITTVAGTETGGYAGDGSLAMMAQLDDPDGVAVDTSGNLYISDFNNHRIRLVTKSNGIISTMAGTGTPGYSGDTSFATMAQLYYPYRVAADTLGNLYISEYFIHRIRLVTKIDGLITTMAGTGTRGYAGDGGPATLAQLSYPAGVTVDATGNLYISDSFNNRIRLVTKIDGIITTVAGTGTPGYAGDTSFATMAQLKGPTAVALDTSGNLYISDSFNNRIRLVTKIDGIITTVAGSPSPA